MNDCIIASLLPPPGWGASGAFSWNYPVFRVFLWNADEIRSFRHSSNNCSGTATLALAFSFHKLESSRKTDTKNIFICSLSNQNCWVSHGCSAEELGFLRGRWTCWLTQRRKLSLFSSQRILVLSTALSCGDTWIDTITPAKSLILLFTYHPEGIILQDWGCKPSGVRPRREGKGKEDKDACCWTKNIF